MVKRQLRTASSWRLLILTAAFLLLAALHPVSTFAETNAEENRTESYLSSYWEPAIRQWAPEIHVLGQMHGLDPDLIAAVVMEESNGIPDGISVAGAVGLMGVMPRGPGLEWRPTQSELLNPAVNLRWGVAILAEVVRQSGGDLYSALGAYSGGWEHADSTIPRMYAASILDNYGRAVLLREGLDPEIATQWTIAIELKRGYVPDQTLLILGEQPVSGLRTFAHHVIYNYVDKSGRAYFISGYVVPVALVVPANNTPHSTGFLDSQTLDPYLSARISDGTVKISSSNPRVILACLPSLSRLRGHVSTRWFAPSACPDWHR